MYDHTRTLDSRKRRAKNLASYHFNQCAFMAIEKVILLIEGFPLLIAQIAYECRSKGRVDYSKEIDEAQLNVITEYHACEECNARVLQFVEQTLEKVNHMHDFVSRIGETTSKKWVYESRFPRLFTHMLHDFVWFVNFLEFLRAHHLTRSESFYYCLRFHRISLYAFYQYFNKSN